MFNYLKENITMKLQIGTLKNEMESTHTNM